MDKIGLIAGGGEFPIIFARSARAKGAKVICFAVSGMTDPEIEGAVDRIHWINIGQVAKFVLLLKIERIKRLAMLGKIDKSAIYKNINIKKDETVNEFFKGLDRKNDYSILEEFTRRLNRAGVEVIDGVEYIPELLPTKGVLTGRKPTPAEEEDIEYGNRIARVIARHDIGQTLVVKQKNVVAVEAMEGTDETIKRAAGLSGEGFVVCKVARPNQDMRWDVPIVGPETIRTIVECGGSVLSIEEKKMFLVNRAEVIRLADENGVSVVVV